jgi:flagellar hook-associated protein 2
MLTGANTGAANSIVVAASGGDGGLAQLAYDPAGTQNLTQLQAAQDADIKVNTLDVTSATNTVSGAIAGVTLSLLAASANNTTQSLSVSNDTSSAIGKVTSFVNAYNALQKTMGALGSYDSSSQTAGPLLGDALLLGLQDQLQRGMFNAVPGLTGDITSLAAIGITTDASGKMALDTTKLQAALNSSYNAVGAVFGSANGVAARLSTTLSGALGAGGMFSSRTTSLNTQMKQTQDDQTQQNARIAVIQARYLTQFTALDSLLTSLQSTSKYLTQQLASLPGVATTSSTKTG